jgi:hypothetical protein
VCWPRPPSGQLSRPLRQGKGNNDVETDQDICAVAVHQCDDQPRGGLPPQPAADNDQRQAVGALMSWASATYQALRLSGLVDAGDG